MTSLQDKIDAMRVFNNTYVCRAILKEEVNKAIEELREAIVNSPNLGYSSDLAEKRDIIFVEDVLSLIGEKK